MIPLFRYRLRDRADRETIDELVVDVELPSRQNLNGFIPRSLVLVY